jgi:hypothetical protein
MSTATLRHRPSATDPLTDELRCPTCNGRKSNPAMTFCNPCWMHLPMHLRSALLKHKRPGKAKHIARPGFEAIHAVNLQACTTYLTTHPRKP